MKDVIMLDDTFKYKRIGIFGGTFDPVHNGHKHIAEVFNNSLNLDCLVIIPACNPPHKQYQMFNYEERVEMLRLAFKDVSNVVISCIEKDEKINHTIDVIKSVKETFEAFHKCTFYFMIGQDNLYDMHTWKCAEDIIKEVTLVVMKRKGFVVDKHKISNIFDGKTFIFTDPLFEQEVSASEIRKCIRTLDPDLENYIQEDVHDYINHTDWN